MYDQPVFSPFLANFNMVVEKRIMLKQVYEKFRMVEKCPLYYAYVNNLI